MTYGLPVRGQADWDDELNNSVENLRGKADGATAKADNAVSTANSAANLALAADARSRMAVGRVVADVLGEPLGAAELDSDGRLPAGQLTAGTETAVGAQAKADAARDEVLAQKGANSGIAPLDAAGLLPDARVPDRLTEASLNATIARPKTAADTAALGAELFSGGTWDLGLGWTGDAATGFTYVYPGSGAPADHKLTWTPPFDPTGKRYVVTYTVTNDDNNALFTGHFGGTSLSIMYQGGVSPITYSRGVVAATSEGLVIAPEVGTWSDSTVTNFSVREVLTRTDPSSVSTDSDGAVAIERRTGPVALRNLLEGRNAGAWNVNGFANSVLGDGAFAANVSGFWNAGVGTDTLRDNISGSRNCTLGVFSLLRNTTGHRNIAVGPYALPYNTTGHNNVCAGVDGMWENTTGSYNVGIGTAALANNTTGQLNVGIGRFALGMTGTSSGHIGIGNYAGAAVATASQGRVVAIGYDALRNANASRIIAIGQEAAYSLTTAHDQVVIGHQAFYALTDKATNTGVGNFVGKNVNGADNVAFGWASLRGADAGSTATRNTSFGMMAGYNVTTAARNTLIGYSAGSDLTSGADNILIGYQAQANSPTDTHRLNIGNLIYGKMDTGRVGIGVNGPLAALHIKAGTSTVAPLKIDAGTLVTTVGPSLNGAIEFDGTNLYFTAGGVRKQLATV